MAILTSRSITERQSTRGKTGKMPLAFDQLVELEINGSTQRIRICADRTGLPPLLVVQAGPGLPLLHEAAKFRQRLNLEKDFHVGYWDQRGCGAAPLHDAGRVSLQQQVDDLCAVLKWFKARTSQPALVLGISLGATIALMAAGLEPDAVKALVAVSPDANTVSSDAHAASFIREQNILANNYQFIKKVMQLGEPPYTDSSKFQLRARILCDLGGIERGRKFGEILRETLLSLIGTYGLFGAVRALRNINAIQNKMLSELAPFDLFANPPRLLVPVHYIFGEDDPLTPAKIVKQLPLAVSSPQTTVAVVSNAGHMVHFDQSELVRSIVVRAAHESC